ncbi:MAG: ion transporter [Burkholderiaceae bacterium]|nr:ion transporter [Burkholderiaceae bacterium]
MARQRYFNAHPEASGLQLRAFEILFGKTPGDLTRQVLDWGITLLVLGSIIAIILESVPSLQDRFQSQFDAFEVFSIAIFTVEYLLRLWCVPAGKAHLSPTAARWGYITSFHGLIDLCATLPFYLHAVFPGLDMRFMRAVRMLRFLKLSHYNTALEDLFRAIRDEHESFVSALYILGIAILMTSCLAYYAEHDVQPDKFGSIPDAMWWSVVTLTTVGYGDAAPVTAIGKLIGVATALMGVCTVALLTGIVASSFANQMARKRAIFEAELIKALQDGHISHEEEEMLEHLRQTFNLSKEHANAIVKRVRQEHTRSSQR